MTELDDPAALGAADPGGMLGAVVGLSHDCREGYSLGLATPELPSADGVSAIVFCGMGGSAVAGDVLAALAAPRLRTPLIVERSTDLPEFCGPHTIVVASSYSGTTAETLSLFDEAVRRGCRVIALTSGGELARRAEDLSLPRVLVPGGSMPRAAFGYLTFGVVGALERAGVLPPMAADVDDAVRELEGVMRRDGPAVATPRNPSKRFALELRGRVPVVWGAAGIGAVAARRWMTQFNENAKIPAFASTMPELDHNEVVGWSAGLGEGFAVIALRHDGEPADVATRFEPSLDIARAAGAHVGDVWARGRSPVARLMTLIAIGDLVSTYLGIVRGVDPTPIEAIEGLKRMLAER